jgi:hypothetical protein
MGDLTRFTPGEIEAKRKKISRILQSECGRDVLGAMLGMDFSEAPDLNGKPMVEVLVPTYKAFDPLMDAAAREMLKHSRQFCTVNVQPTMPCGVVHWARNMLLAPLYRDKSKFTHVLFMDDDMLPEKDFLVRLLRHEKDIVGALATHRTDPPLPNISRWDAETNSYYRVFDWKKDALIGHGGTVAVGAGMLLISRHALDLIAEFYLNCEYELQMWAPAIDKLEETRAKRRAFFEETGNALWFDFLKAPNGKAELGEDVSFCYKAHLCGLKVYVDTSIQPGHVGKYTYGIKDFLPYQQELLAAEGKAGWKFRLNEDAE